MNFVIDTNVLRAANGKADHLTEKEELICINFLENLKNNKFRVSWDSAFLIYDEYAKHCNHRGFPGTGDIFFKWLYDNQGHSNICECVDITKNGDTFEEFPNDLELERFDKSDHKFVAVAIKSNFSPTIVNASDSDWHNHREILSKYVHVLQLCPHLFI